MKGAAMFFRGMAIFGVFVIQEVFDALIERINSIAPPTERK